MNGALRELRNGGEGIWLEDRVAFCIQACIWVAYETKVHLRYIVSLPVSPCVRYWAARFCSCQLQVPNPIC